MNHSTHVTCKMCEDAFFSFTLGFSLNFYGPSQDKYETQLLSQTELYI